MNDNSLTTSTEVLVIGGGPAGSTVATLLAQKGHSVTLFEKEKFPRDHVGESLLPYCYPIFEELGVLDEMIKMSVRKPGVRFVDIDGRSHTTWCFGHVIKDLSALSFHVRRDRFDEMMLRNAAKHGVSVYEETRVMQVDLGTDSNEVTAEVTRSDGSAATFRGDFIVDCSGRDTVLANRNGWKKPHEELDRVAISSHWLDVKFNGGLDEGLLQIVYLGGEKKGWIWVIPVGANRVSIGTVVNSDYYKHRRAELKAAGTTNWVADFYEQEIGQSQFIADVISGGRMVFEPVVNGDYSYKSEVKYGKNFALVGDAHAFIDPIFASGIFLSMNSARLVAEALDERFSNSLEVGQKAMEAAYSKIVGAYNLVEKAIRLFYNPTAINFAQTQDAEELIHERHKNALASMHYLLAGDFFNRHEEYSRVIDLLADPSLFEKYKALVVDRPEYDHSTCDLGAAEIFSEFLIQEAAAPE